MPRTTILNGVATDANQGGSAVKAAVVPQFKAPLEIRDIDVPRPGPGQVLVRIEASGLCHTDIHAAHGDWPVKPKMPLVPGHEGVGSIVELGDGVSGGVDGLAIGRRIAGDNVSG